MILVISGLPGSGKSLKLAKISLDVLWRNRKWEKSKHNPEHKKRYLYTNLEFSDWVMEEYGDLIRPWIDTDQLTPLRDADVIWDEMAAALDNTNWQNMGLELKRWLQQHRKFGVEIYATAQDFAQVDKSARRLVTDLLYLTKVIGSPDPSPTLPPVKYVWGLVMVRALDPTRYDEQRSKFENSGDLPKFFLINKRDTEVYDMRAEVGVGSYPPLRHIERRCENHDCLHVKTVHV